MPRPSRVRNPGNASLAERLEVLVKKFGSMTELAKRAGVSSSALSRCMKGSEPSLSTAVAVCSATGASLDWLATGESFRGPPDDIQSPRIPFYNVEASAGAGLIPIENQDTHETVALPPGIVVGIHGQNAARNWCAIQAKGDSMEPTIRNGALLIIDRSDQQVREGIYVVRRGDVLLVKRTQPRENQILRLQSDNRQYESEDIDLKDSSQSFHILGRVIWTGAPI